MMTVCSAFICLLLISQTVNAYRSTDYYDNVWRRNHDLQTASSEQDSVETLSDEDYSQESLEDDFESYFVGDPVEKPKFSAYDDPQQNEALFTPEPKTNNDKRNEYYENLARKAENAFPTIGPFKSVQDTVEDLQAGASDSDYYMPRSRRASKLSDYDEYYPKRGVYDSVEYIPNPRYSARDYDMDRDYREEGMYKSSSPYTPPYSNIYNKPNVSPPKKYSSRPRSAVSSPVVSSALGRSPSLPKRASRLLSPQPKPQAFRPITTPQKLYNTKPSTDYQARHTHSDSGFKPSTDYQARHTYSDSGLSSKPLVKPWKTEKRNYGPNLSSEEGRLFLSASNYGKPVREQFHEQGTTGPHSYKFGYNTGDKDNPMARYEERDADGIVKGSYSFVDPLGELKIVRYESHPVFGFRTSA